MRHATLLAGVTALVALCAVMALAGCGSTGTTPSTGPSLDEVHSNGDSAQIVYDQCKRWAEEGKSKDDVGALIGTYEVGGTLTPAEQDAATAVCAKGFVAGGG